MNSLLKKVILIISLYYLATGRDCYTACDDTPLTYDKKICYSDCDLRVVVGATVGSFTGLSVLVILICCCSNTNRRCLYFVRKKLQKNFNQVQIGKKNKTEFQRYVTDIINALKKSEFINNFYYVRGQDKFALLVNNQSIYSQSKQQFLTQINFNGRDNEHGNFIAQGFFLIRKGEPFFWFMLRYDPYDLAEKRGMQQIVVFESVKITTMALNGVWSLFSKENLTPSKWFLVFRLQDQNSRLVDVFNTN